MTDLAANDATAKSSAQTAVSLVWAQARGGVIGKDNAIPWRLPEDMAHFKAFTWGRPVIMGRRTWESLPPKFRPLPGRLNIVVTSSELDEPDVAIERSVDSALAGHPGACVIGGAQIYAAAMHYATELVVTEIDLDVCGDAFAPAIDSSWTAESDAPWQASSSGLRYRLVRYVRP
jgi:dihydrofolate reductase